MKPDAEQASRVLLPVTAIHKLHPPQPPSPPIPPTARVEHETAYRYGEGGARSAECTADNLQESEYCEQVLGTDGRQRLCESDEWSVANCARACCESGFFPRLPECSVHPPPRVRTRGSAYEWGYALGVAFSAAIAFAALVWALCVVHERVCALIERALAGQRVLSVKRWMLRNWSLLGRWLLSLRAPLRSARGGITGGGSDDCMGASRGGVTAAAQPEKEDDDDAGTAETSPPPPLSAAEYQAVTIGANQTARPWYPSESPADDTAHGLIDRCAAAHPSAIALRQRGSSSDRSAQTVEVTYAELSRRSDALAAALAALGLPPAGSPPGQKQGVGREKEEERGGDEGRLIGVLFEPCVAAVVGILGILKAGGAYVPLDPSFPRGRIVEIVDDDASCAAVLVQSSELVRTKWPGEGEEGLRAKLFVTDALGSIVEHCSLAGTRPPASPTSDTLSSTLSAALPSTLSSTLPSTLSSTPPPAAPTEDISRLPSEASEAALGFSTLGSLGGGSRDRTEVDAEGGVVVTVPSASPTYSVSTFSSTSSPVASTAATTSSSLVYVMYTSGSTGKPKGVMVEHGALNARCKWMQEAYPIATGDVVPLKTKLIFGISEWELFWTLGYGGTLDIVPREELQRPADFCAGLAASGASVVFLVPSHLTAMLVPLSEMVGTEEKGVAAVRTVAPGPPPQQQQQTARCASHPLRTLRHIVCCGEALPTSTVASFHAVVDRLQQMAAAGSAHPRCELHNLYGPTEGSMTAFPCPPSTVAILIGKPIANTVVILVEPGTLNPVRDGTPGEILFGGCIARGYLGNPELSARLFVPNSLFPNARTAAVHDGSGGAGGGGNLDARTAAGHDGSGGVGGGGNPSGVSCNLSGVPHSPLLYRTGDLAVRLPSGDLAYHGRIDRQAKVRGYRIELEAVEAALKDFPPLVKSGARICCVAVRPEGTEEAPAELVAFVQLRDAEADTPGPFEGILAHCAASLPPYMVPSRVEALAPPGFPLLASGKIDLKRLARGECKGVQLEEATVGLSAHVGTGAVTDSLGQVRALGEGVSGDVGSLEREAAVLDVLRAWFMFGVVVDHFTECNERICTLVVGNRTDDGLGRGLGLGDCELILSVDASPTMVCTTAMCSVANNFVRAFGNWKCMSGFAMVSAYAESGFASGSQLSRSDAVALLLLLTWVWVIDPLAWNYAPAAFCPQVDSDGRCGQYQWSAPRWYLQWVLFNKLLLVAMRLLRLPALAQCLLVLSALLLSPPGYFCLTETACKDDDAVFTSTIDAWWRQLRPWRWGVLKALLVGPDGEDGETLNDWFELNHLVSAPLLYLSAQYVVVHHYGRLAVKRAGCAWRRALLLGGGTAGVATDSSSASPKAGRAGARAFAGSFAVRAMRGSALRGIAIISCAFACVTLEVLTDSDELQHGNERFRNGVLDLHSRIGANGSSEGELGHQILVLRSGDPRHAAHSTVAHVVQTIRSEPHAHHSPLL